MHSQLAVLATCLIAAVVVGSATLTTNNRPPFQTVKVSAEYESPLQASYKGDPYQYIHYDQCDPRWANDEMGKKGQVTICRGGCTMTSVAMALATLGVRINTTIVTPKNLNLWLLANNGYVCVSGDCSILSLNATELLTPKMNFIADNAKPSYQDIKKGIQNAQVIYIAHVRNTSHFVLVTKVHDESRQIFEINDPLQAPVKASAVMPYTDITNIIRYKINIYPSYKQCDDRWASVKMGGNNETICQVGCLMSSISMAIGGNHITIPPHAEVSTPLSVDHWLQNNNGFVSNSSSLKEEVMGNISPSHIVWNNVTSEHLTNDLSFDSVINRLNGPSPQVLIANVMDGGHFVLIVGYRGDGDTLVVNDPGFNRNTYSHSKDVVGYRIFFMSPAAH